MTKREKILLYALAVVAIIAGAMVLLIQPAMEKSSSLDAALLERQMAADSIRSSLLTAQGLQAQIAENEAGIAEESEYFLPMMTNNELDEYITGLLQTHGLTALSLAIADAAADAETDAAASDSDIRVYQVHTTARGTMPQFMLLVDTVNALDGIRIAALTNKQDAVTTPAPTATPKPNRKAKATPAPLFTTPAPTAAEGTYTMNILFSVQEYAGGASTSVSQGSTE